MIGTINRPKTNTEIKKQDTQNYYVSEFFMHVIGSVVTVSLKPCKDKTKLEVEGLSFRLINVFDDLDKAISFIKNTYPKAKELPFGTEPQFVKYRIIKIFDID